MTDARDAAALRKIYDARAERLLYARARAEKWIAGLTALVTVLATAMVVKGPENFAKAEGPVRAGVLVLVTLGALGIGIGLISAYTAAFGGLFRRGAVDRLLDSPPARAAGVADALDRAARVDAGTSTTYMRIALSATVLAMVALVAAVAVAWSATADTKPSDAVCVQAPEGVLKASTADLTVESGSVALVACPEEVTADGG